MVIILPVLLPKALEVEVEQEVQVSLDQSALVVKLRFSSTRSLAEMVVGQEMAGISLY